MKKRLLWILALAPLTGVVGCDRESSPEGKLEAEFQAMPPVEKELGDFDGKLTFPSAKKCNGAEQGKAQ